MSFASSVNDALSGYAAGRVTAEQLVAVVATAYYGDGGRGTRDGLKPIMEIIERAHPGVVELTGNAAKPGFAVRLAERPFPKRYEQELRQAAQAIATPPPSSEPGLGLWQRVVGAVRRLFSA
jgi:hypothetical protein